MKKLVLSAVVLIAGLIIYLENDVHNNAESHIHQSEAGIHSGGTDRYGGHHDRKRGGYHYHHGCGPHSHSGGCEYNYKSCN